MDWVSELRHGFRQLPTGQAAGVSFADREDAIGDVGREFNALAAALGEAGPGGLGREQVHALRNRLAGILAALHVLRAGEELSSEQEEELRDVVEAARKLDAAWRGGRA